MAAHLGGVVAAHTLHPVIGVPIDGTLDGLDALLSTVQMPRGVPVATVTIGKTGFINASLLAAQILALSDGSLFRNLKKFRQKMAKEVLKADKKINRMML
jgi:phosphoribosylaminoimidazole carboxylase PurE protein